MRTKSPALFFLYLIIIALATAPAFALGPDNRNLFLIGLMGISPFLIVRFNRFHKSDVWLTLLLISLIAAPLLNHPETMRWSTVLYSGMFGLTFMAYTRLLHFSKFKLESYLKLVKYLIYAYFIVLFIQQFCVLAGLPIFNISNYNPDEPWKLNSLAPEPSHSARIVALLMYCYILIKELVVRRTYNFLKDFKVDKWVWIAFIWTMITMGSGTAFLFILIVLLKFIQRKNILPLFLILLVMAFIIDRLGITAMDRTFDTFMATLSLDPETIIAADQSASFRIVPIIVLASMLNISTLDGWLGHGVDYVSTILYQYVRGGGENVNGGGLLAMAIEFGMLSFLLFVIFSLGITFSKKDKVITIVFWFMLVFLNAYNTQIVWLTLILLFTNNHFYRKSRAHNKLIPNKVV